MDIDTPNKPNLDEFDDIKFDTDDMFVDSTVPTAIPNNIYMDDAQIGPTEYYDRLKLRKYYQELFPFDILVDWLTFNYDPEKESINDYYSKREFSTRYVVKSKPFVIRNKSFPTVDEEIKSNDLKEFVLGTVDEHTFTAKVPEKLDIGPVYSREPIKMNQYQDYRPVERELVFDIDIDDYNDIRVCCDGTSLCKKCWQFLSISAKFLELYLKECYNFQHILYVFSGRRGLHVWVSDRGALTLSKDLRQKIISYAKPGFEANQTPILQRAFDEIFLPSFENYIVEDQELFTMESQIKKLLDLLPGEIKLNKKSGKKYETINVRVLVEDDLKENPNQAPLDKWKKIKNLLLENDIKEYLYRIVFHYTFPRLDEQVSIGLNHLLKSPFCIHPSTQKLCIPLDIDLIDYYDPNDIPTLPKLLSELDQKGSTNPSPSKMDTDQKKSRKSKSSKQAPPTNFNYYKSFFKNYVNNIKLSKSNPNPLDF
ncbi:DNA polymerase alpha primase subunit [Tieghemostelium lacteum]|uniref:DNA primase n=1 Tax=Tieghemostelium lacteum TaxID=361077 RepID=A0A151ZDH0_TIELA|nr:DNA polymerase alpha primase subunit [Tieghemostelium lacteum]|eukprot:KYQ91934.1 DNA polymerase alpha primase subunit [Tieghemostelium lacteum]